ncbi:MAG: lytic transglycosylase domain-containing protein [Crocinitomicaceae bacterium]
MKFTLIRFSFFISLFTLILSACSTTEPSDEKKIQPIETIENKDQFQLPKLPKSVSFCGEDFPLDNFDVRERLDKEIIVNAYYHSSTIQGLKRANRYFPEIEKILKENGVPDDFKYLCLIESGLVQAISPAGARGFWQFMPATAMEFNLEVNSQIDERLDISKSTVAACSYLRNAQNKFKNWMLTAASYNAGVGGIGSALEDQMVVRYFDLHLNNETSRYVFRILAMKIIFENPEAYGFSKEQIELYEPIPKRKVQVKNSISDLKQWAKANGSNYHILKVLNPWILTDKLKVTNEVLTIELPK